MNIFQLFPSPKEVIKLIIERHDYFLYHWSSTFLVALAAAIFALMFTLAISFFLARFPLLRKPLAPLISVSQSFPLQAIAPLFIVLFGSGYLPKFIVATLISFFPMFASYSESLQTVPQRLINYASICGATKWQVILDIKFPYSLPQLAASSKVGFTLASLGAVVAEFISPDKGMGYVLLVAQSNFDIPTIYICTGLLAAQGIVVYWLLSILEVNLAQRRSIYE
ncbi:MAG: ABC transporter permease subunit [candidate division Zixibacteria bacterium]|nr:ABC transporter permease subunit [candidate division Zixibacteria bacterium]